MTVFSNKEKKRLFRYILIILLLFIITSQLSIWINCRYFSLLLLLSSSISACGILGVVYWYLRKQEAIEEEAENQINAYLDGNTDARISCNKEGQLYRLFNSINAMAAILDARVANEFQAKEFLRSTISDISHQLKTPLAALNIYNSLIYDGVQEDPAIKDLCEASERELDRLDTLVQNLLKITRLDAGMIVIEKVSENIGEIMKEVELHFAYRAKQEEKSLLLSGKDQIYLLCDRDWILEAVNNIVKNAFDHTQKGDSIYIEWKQFATILQIKLSDNGCGIHSEDLHHIFKRFYRSRFSKDTQGLGLGLSLAKGIIEAHGGTIEVFSELGKGTTFLLNFLIPTKL